jgi:acyl carrier protein
VSFDQNVGEKMSTGVVPDPNRDASLEKVAVSELAVAAIWAEVLQCSDSIRSESNFFALGGDSLSIMMMLFRVEEEFGLEVDPAILIESPTLQGFCTALIASGDSMKLGGESGTALASAESWEDGTI